MSCQGPGDPILFGLPRYLEAGIECRGHMNALRSLHSRASRLYQPSRDHFASVFSVAQRTLEKTIVKKEDIIYDTRNVLDKAEHVPLQHRTKQTQVQLWTWTPCW